MKYPEIQEKGVNFTQQLIAEGDKVYALSDTQVLFVPPEKMDGIIFDYKERKFYLVDQAKIEEALKIAEDITDTYK